MTNPTPRARRKSSQTERGEPSMGDAANVIQEVYAAFGRGDVPGILERSAIRPVTRPSVGETRKKLLA